MDQTKDRVTYLGKNYETSPEFDEAMADGETCLLQIIKRPGTQNLGMQFLGSKPRSSGASGARGELVAAGIGIENADQTRMTVFLPLAKQTAEKLQLSAGAYCQSERVITLNDYAEMLGLTPNFNIEMTESPHQSPNNPNQDVVRNPDSGEPVLVNDKPYYRHVDVIRGSADDQNIHEYYESPETARKYSKSDATRSSSEQARAEGSPQPVKEAQ